MDEKSLFAEFWSTDTKTTSKLLARIPEGSDYRPDPKSRTAREIAWQSSAREDDHQSRRDRVVEWAPSPPPAPMKELATRMTGRARISWSALAGAASRTLGRRARLFGRQRPARRWRGAFSSTSCTTVAISLVPAADGVNRNRRYTALVRTSPYSPCSRINVRHQCLPVCLCGVTGAGAVSCLRLSEILFFDCCRISAGDSWVSDPSP